MSDSLSWTPPEGGNITFPAGTTPAEVSEFIRNYKRSKSQPKVYVEKHR